MTIISKFIYLKENEDWNYENKLKYGFSSTKLTLINRLHACSEEHSNYSKYTEIYQIRINPKKYKGTTPMQITVVGEVFFFNEWWLAFMMIYFHISIS